MKNYIIGLDIGTNSVGWAVVLENNQRIMKKGNKSLWGVRLFDEALTAEARRNFRSTRRRYFRRKERIKLLQDEFKDEINKVDSNFFKKLEESKFHENDRENKQIILSDLEKKEIKKYHEYYPTIYHLRKRLIEDSSKADIRLVYLAIHHIIKYRGNFLYDKKNFKIENLDIKEKLYELFCEATEQISDVNISDDLESVLNLEKIEEILLTKTKNDIKKELKEELKEFNFDNFSSEFIKAMIGYKFNIDKILNVESTGLSISLTNDDYDKNLDDLEKKLGNKVSVIMILKDLYDMIFLKKIFKGSDNKNISSLMVERYQNHKKDLKLLKDIFREDRILYKELFKTQKDKKCLYSLYVENKESKEDFYKKIRDRLKKISEHIIDESNVQKINLIDRKMNNGDFLPKITDVENGKYPYQLNEEELIHIINNQRKYYPFLANTLNDGTYKLEKLLKFKIPYYVGPLVSEKKSKFAWMERKIENQKITPYNFDEVIDKDKTAEKFIKRMISKCTYLFNEYVLPNNSILYSEFKVLNELKQIKINGDRLQKDQILEIMNELFYNYGSVTDKKFVEYLQSKNWYPMYDELQVTGYSSNKKFANSMQSYIDFFGDNGIFSNIDYQKEDAEIIIEWITIFEDKEILKNKIKNTFSKLNDNQIELILKKNYSGWGNLSKKLLTEIVYKDSILNVDKSIIELMYETKENFIQIINNDKYGFQEIIKNYNNKNLKQELSYDVVNELTTSPAVKKGIYQALKIVKELVSYIGYEPKYISIEMSREEGKKGKVSLDRKSYLINKYNDNKNLINNYNNLMLELNSQENVTEKTKLYFMQEGKCLYCGKPLDIQDLTNCEIDHIIPRTLIKDNSFCNKALVHSEHNQIKKDSFILPKEFRTEQIKIYWNHLKSINLMSAKKFYYLNRREFNEEEIQGFINRQLVETRQITKHVANILSNYYKDTHVIYLKSSLSSDYRKKFELFKYRSLNDYHHAHDAYLAAVLGEYKEKYLKYNVDFELIRELNFRLKANKKYNDLKYGFAINSLDDLAYDIISDLSDVYVSEKTGEVLFNSHDFNKRVEETLYRNDIFVTRKQEIKTDEFYNQNPISTGNIPLKKYMPVEKYGGYTSMNNAYISLVKCGEKNKIVGIPIHVAMTLKDDNVALINYIKDYLNTENVEILKEKIPFNTLIVYKNHLTSIRGYGYKNKTCELANAYELKIPKDKLKKWKYTLNKVINNKDIPVCDSIPKLTEEEFRKQLIEILNFLYDEKAYYPLYENSINKIKSTINVDYLSQDELIKIINQILILYKCNSVNANLKDYNLGDRIGRLNVSLTSGIIIYKSITGLKEYKYEF